MIRQGYPLSPDLFNTYINDSIERLNKMNKTSIKLNNGVNLSFLLYVDDIAIVSLSEEDLQNCFDELMHIVKHAICKK